MAFGRDGSELEMYLIDMQNRVLKDALNLIIETSSDDGIIKIAKSALKRSVEIAKRMDD